MEEKRKCCSFEIDREIKKEFNSIVARQGKKIYEVLTRLIASYNKKHSNK
jgi:hypothetical protein